MARETRESDRTKESDLPKIGKPATRALAALGITCLEQVARLSARDLLAMHGVGPKAVSILDDALRASGKSLRASD